MVDRDVDELNAVVTNLDQAEAFFCDVSVPEETAKMVKSVLAWTGQIDVVVNNAGIADFGPIEETDFLAGVGSWQRIWTVYFWFRKPV